MLGFGPLTTKGQPPAVACSANAFAQHKNQLTQPLRSVADQWGLSLGGEWDPALITAASGIDDGTAVPLDVEFRQLICGVTDENDTQDADGITLRMDEAALIEKRIRAGWDREHGLLTMERGVYGTRNGQVKTARIVGTVLARAAVRIATPESAVLANEIGLRINNQYAEVFAQPLDDERAASARVLASAFDHDPAPQGLDRAARFGIGLLHEAVEPTRFIFRLAAMYVETSNAEMSRLKATTWHTGTSAPIIVVRQWADYRRELGRVGTAGGPNVVPWGAYRRMVGTREFDYLRVLRMAAAQNPYVARGRSRWQPLIWPAIPDLCVLTTCDYDAANVPDVTAAFTPELVYAAAIAWCDRYASVGIFHDAVSLLQTLYWKERNAATIYAAPFPEPEVALPPASMCGYLMLPFLDTDEARAEQRGMLSNEEFYHIVGNGLARAHVIGVTAAWVKARLLDYGTLSGVLQPADYPLFQGLLRRSWHFVPLWARVQQALDSMGYMGGVGRYLSSLGCSASSQDYVTWLQSGDGVRSSSALLGWIRLIPAGSAAEGWTHPKPLPVDIARAKVPLLAADVIAAAGADPIPMVLETAGIDMLAQRQDRATPRLRGKLLETPRRTADGFYPDQPFMAITDRDGNRYRHGFRLSMEAWSAVTQPGHDRFNLTWWVTLGGRGTCPRGIGMVGMQPDPVPELSSRGLLTDPINGIPQNPEMAAPPRANRNRIVVRAATRMEARIERASRQAERSANERAAQVAAARQRAAWANQQVSEPPASLMQLFRAARQQRQAEIAEAEEKDPRTAEERAEEAALQVQADRIRAEREAELRALTAQVHAGENAPSLTAEQGVGQESELGANIMAALTRRLEGAALPFGRPPPRFLQELPTAEPATPAVPVSGVAAHEAVPADAHGLGSRGAFLQALHSSPALMRRGGDDTQATPQPAAGEQELPKCVTNVMDAVAVRDQLTDGLKGAGQYLVGTSVLSDDDMLTIAHLHSELTMLMQGTEGRSNVRELLERVANASAHQKYLTYHLLTPATLLWEAAAGRYEVGDGVLGGLERARQDQAVTKRMSTIHAGGGDGRSIDITLIDNAATAAMEHWDADESLTNQVFLAVRAMMGTEQPLVQLTQMNAIYRRFSNNRDLTLNEANITLAALGTSDMIAGDWPAAYSTFGYVAKPTGVVKDIQLILEAFHAMNDEDE